jgi:hypothetical protein
MGYTHYWTIEKQIDESDWEKFLNGAVQIVTTATDAGIALDNDSAEKIVFINGVGEGAHETFAITATDTGFNFCKTAEKPYDTVVTAILILLKETLGENVKVTSDGDWNDWQGGQLLYETVFDKQPDSVLG